MARRTKTKALVDTAARFDTPLKRVLYKVFVRPGLEKALGIERLNRTYARINEAADTPSAFAEALFRELDLDYTMAERDLEALRACQGPLVLVSNHPYGGLEALFLMLLMGSVRPDYRLLANDIFADLAPMGDKLIALNPFRADEPAGRSNFGTLRELLAFLEGGGVVAVFPAGEAPRFDFKTRRLREPEWNPLVARLIQRTRASVAPVYFHGRGSLLFHLAGSIHPRLRTRLQFRELTRRRHHSLRFRVGRVLTPERLAAYDTPDALTRFLQSKVYLLASTYTDTRTRINWNQPFKQLLRKPAKGEPKEVIAPVAVNILLDEQGQLGEGNRLFYQQNFEVLAFRGSDAPMLLTELGRLRELTFRAVGEGTGKAVDLDEYDEYYEHLVIWNHAKQEIVGAYRIARCDEVLAQHGPKGLYLTSLFEIQPELFERIHPALELGRSIVRQEYQRSYQPLMLLWSGIGDFLVQDPRSRYLVGPASISNAFHRVSMLFIVAYLRRNHLHAELSQLVKPRNPFRSDLKNDQKLYESLGITNLNDIQQIITFVEQEDLRVPILIKHYLKLGSDVLEFNVDPDFQDAIDALMLTHVPSIPPEVLRKYMTDAGYASYLSHHREAPQP